MFRSRSLSLSALCSNCAIGRKHRYGQARTAGTGLVVITNLADVTRYTVAHTYGHRHTRDNKSGVDSVRLHRLSRSNDFTPGRIALFVPDRLEEAWSETWSEACSSIRCRLVVKLVQKGTSKCARRSVFSNNRYLLNSFCFYVYYHIYR